MKRKHSGVGALGLGGYASDEDEEENGSQEQGGEDVAEEEIPRGQQGAGVLLPHYRSRESLDLDDMEGIDAAAKQEEERRQSPAAAETSGADGEGDAGRGSQEPDPANPLSRLPPELREPLPTTCPEGLQHKFSQYLHTLNTKGISLTDQIMQRKAFRNPDFLQKLVDHFNVQEHGSAFPPDVFQPGSLPTEDTIDQLLRALEREQERRARAREQAMAAGGARIDFSKGAGSLGHIPASHSNSNLIMAQNAAALAQAAVARVVGSKR